MLRQALARGPVWALGAMSGTSLDGVDAALVLTDGDRIEGFGTRGYRPYGAAERAAIRAAFGRWEDGPEAQAAEEAVEIAHGEALATLSQQAALVGFHGQTVAHEPQGRGTRQLGSGQRLADALERPVVWDFRSADIRMGGEGAPLAPFFHHACARWLGAEAPVAFLNLGGVGNLTWADPRIPSPEAPGACLAFDTGPANAPINDLMQARLGQDHDAGGALAATGEVHEPVLERLLADRHFRRIPPKSLDRDAFAWLAEAVAELSDADAAATLTACAAAAVAAGFEHLPDAPARLLVTGGGRRNQTLMAMIAAAVDAEVAPVESAGLDGDMLEAQAFAYLAVRVARGWPTSAPGTTGVAAPVGGGVLSHPRGAAAIRAG